MMMRWGAMIAGIFAAGFAAGLLLSRVQADVVPQNAPTLPSPDAAELPELRAAVKHLEEERAMLAARNEALETETAALRNDQSLMDDVLQDAAMAEEAPSPTDTPASAPPGAPGPDWRRGGPRPTPEQMAEFRKNFEAQQSRMQDRMADQLSAMNSPNAIENFNALMEYQQSEQELRRQMRDATTDEARAKIETQLRDTRQAQRQLLNDQQNSMLQNLAASSGIKDADAQQKFIDDLRATLDNPFFKMESMLGGGSAGRGGPRGMGFGGQRDGNAN